MKKRSRQWFISDGRLMVLQKSDVRFELVPNLLDDQNTLIIIIVNLEWIGYHCKDFFGVGIFFVFRLIFFFIFQQGESDKLYKQRVRVMKTKQSKQPKRMIFSTSNQAVSHSIDQILTQGAEKMYDKYITAKIPNNLGSKLSKFINIVFDPLTNSNQVKKNNDPFRIHESIMQKLELAKNDKAKRVQDLLRSKEVKLKENQLKASRTINLKVKNQPRVVQGGSFKSSRICNSVQFSHGNGNKKDTFKRLHQDNEQSMSFRLVRDDKSKRYDQQQQTIANNKEKERRSQRHHKHLQDQYKSLQENGDTIVFDYESCQMIFPDPKQKKQKNTYRSKQKNILFLQSAFGEEHKINTNHQIEKPIRYTRKITSFQRTRKHKIRQIQDQDYNNQGERQYSTIPYLQVEQGIKMTEQGTNRTIERPQTSRKISSASTQRTFKSFTRQKIQSLSAFKISQLIPQKPKSRYQQQQTCIKRSANQSDRQSLLWSGKNSHRDHKINKHTDNFALFFQQTCQPEQK